MTGGVLHVTDGRVVAIEFSCEAPEELLVEGGQPLTVVAGPITFEWG